MPYGFFVEVDPARPGHDLPSGPVHPGHDLPPGMPPIGSTLPEPPPGVWPPLTPSAPIQPAPPGTPPGVIWPPIGRPIDPGYGRPGVGAGHPDAGLPVAPGHPDAGLPPSPGHPDAGLPTPPSGTLPAKTWWVVVGIPGVGWRYAAIDPSLSIDHELPEHAEPRRRMQHAP